MPQHFSKTITYDGITALAVIIPEVRPDGVYYEVNVKGFPRFYMTWTALDRYDVVPQQGLNLPYNFVLSLSDAIEEKEKKRHYT